MKYWCDVEIEHLPYSVGSRAVPYNYPAAIIQDNDNYIEVEIIPGTVEQHDYVCPTTMKVLTGECIEVERRIWRANGGMFVENFFMSLSAMGYDEEPVGVIEAFDNAMQII